MARPQPAVLLPVPPFARLLRLQRLPDSDPLPALAALAAEPWGEDRVLGLGAGLVASLGGVVAGLRPFPALAGPSPAVPSTPGDLFLLLRGDDLGDLVHTAREAEDLLADAFEVDDQVDGFLHRDSRDLTGFKDGTENPEGEAAVAAALAADGSSFLAVQRWQHDLDAFEDLEPDEQDRLIGRSRETDEELDDAPKSAHVRRAEQEETGFVLRRSMPWADADGEGLIFLAFGAGFDPFERQLRRMVGLEDGVVDGLFRFTRPLDGAFYWCPPLRGDRLDLRAVGVR